MARRQFGSRGRSGGPRRLSTWVGSADQGYLNVTAGSKIIHQSLTMAGSSLDPDATVVRTRGIISVRPTVFTADVDIIGAVGFTIVSVRAFNAGIGSILGPWTDLGADVWFVWQPISFSLEVGSAADTTFVSSVDIPFDSKAMRKMTNGEVMVVAVESESAAFSISIPFRMLWKLQ